MTTHPRLLRTFAAVAALIGCGVLVLQLFLTVGVTVADGRGVGAGIVAYLGYFTILTNILAALALSAPIVVPKAALGRSFSRPSVITGIAVAMTLVGVVYSLLLRHTWNPQGWQLVADEVLHDVMPLLFLIYWWYAVPQGAVRWTDFPRWCVYPVAYFAYALVRGALIGRYPYPFIDVVALGYGRVLANSVGFLVSFMVIALILLGLNGLKKPAAHAA